MRIREREGTDEAKNLKVTMNDIARAVSPGDGIAGVTSPANIKLSDDTRQRVINVATELGYDRLPRRSRPAQPRKRSSLLVSSVKSFDPFIDAISRSAGSGVAQRDPAHRLRLRRRHRAGAEHHPPAGEAQPYRDYSRVSGHHAGGHDGIRDCTRIPLGAAFNQRDQALPLLPSFIPGRLRQRFPGDQTSSPAGATRIAHITGESWMEASRQRLGGLPGRLQQAGRVRRRPWCARPTGSSASPLPPPPPCWNRPSARTPSSAPATGWRLAAIRRWQ